MTPSRKSISLTCHDEPTIIPQLPYRRRTPGPKRPRAARPRFHNHPSHMYDMRLRPTAYIRFFLFRGVPILIPRCDKPTNIVLSLILSHVLLLIMPVPNSFFFSWHSDLPGQRSENGWCARRAVYRFFVRHPKKGAAHVSIRYNCILKTFEIRHTNRSVHQQKCSY